MTQSVDELHHLPLVEAADLLSRGAVTSVALTTHLLNRINALDPALHAFVTVTADLALAQAEHADAELREGRRRGPLHGVPVAVKDLLFTRGIRTTGGMAVHANFVPDYDATVVARLEQAGAVLLGKLTLTEGAMFEHHPDVPEPRNPWREDLWTGISSSGSGVAAAAGMAFATVGSDTGGSIRFPAATQGLTGVKPTWGRVSRYGSFDLAATFDHLGPLARSAADAATVLGVLAGHDPLDPTSLRSPVPDYTDLPGVAGARGVRLGIDPALLGDSTEPVTRAFITDAARVLVELGATTHELHTPDAAPLLSFSMPMAMAETAAHHAATYPSQAELYGEGTRAALDAGWAASPVDIGRGIIERRAYQGALSAALEQVDALVIPVFERGTPTWAEARALAADDMTVLIRHTWPYDAAGVPTVTLPCGVTEDGRPVALQLVGRHESEAVLLRIAHAYQQVTDWHLRRPPLIS
jgi:amidase